MGQDRLLIEKTDVIEKLHRGLPVLLQAVFHFIHTLRDVDVLQHSAFLRLLVKLHKELFRAAVDRVGGDHESQEIAVIFRLLVQHLLKTDHPVGCKVASDEAPADDAAHAGVPGGLRGLALEHVHVVEAGGAGPDHLLDGEEGGPVGALLGQPVLDRHAALKEPLVKVHVVGVVAHDGHIGVGVHVDKARHDELVLRVDDLIGSQFFCRRCRDDPSVRDKEVLFDDVQGFIFQDEHPSVFNMILHVYPLFFA